MATAMKGGGSSKRRAHRRPYSSSESYDNGAPLQKCHGALRRDGEKTRVELIELPSAPGAFPSWYVIELKLRIRDPELTFRPPPPYLSLYSYLLTCR